MRYLLFFLLSSLAYLQYRWIDQMSVSEKVRMENLFELAGQQAIQQIHGELFYLVQSFRSGQSGREPSRGEEGGLLSSQDLPDVVARSISQWKELAMFPELLKDVYLIRKLDRESDLDSLRKWDEQTGQFEMTTWPQDLARPQLGDIRDRLFHRMSRVPDGSMEGPPPNRFRHIQPELPGIFIPVLLQEEGDTETQTMGRMRRRGPKHGPRVSFLLVLLDRAVLLDSFFPHILTTMAGDAPEHTIAGRILNEHGQPLAAFPMDLSVQGQAPLFSQSLFVLGRGSKPSGPSAGWTLELYHLNGDLNSVIREFRMRNMVLAMLIIGLVAMAVWLVIQNSRKSQRLAQKQLDFVAGISHELLTPLAGVCSAGQNLAQGVVREKAKIQAYGDMIEREGKRLSGLVTQILTYARMESGEPLSEFETVDLADFIQGVLNQANHLLLRHEMEVDFQPSQGRLLVSCDVRALERVVWNLLENACKYAKSGKRILIVLEGHGRESKLRFVNYGPQIPQDEIKTLFEPFQRGRGVAASNVPGSGLGLHIVRRIVELHRGKVDVESTPDQTTFTVLLPIVEKG